MAVTGVDDILIQIGGSTKDFDRAANKTEREIQALGVTTQKAGATANRGLGKIATGFRTIATAAKSFLLLGAITALYQMGKTAIKGAAEMEQMQVAFEVMLGSASKAKKMIADLQKVAAETPYGQAEIVKAAQTMLGFGIEAQKVIPYVKQLGDIAAGNSDRFKSLSLAFSQAQAAGKLMGQDLLQMINAGFNPLKEISRTTGKSISQLKDEMAKGQISAKMLSDAFKSVTSEGGAFYQMSIKQSKTLSGLFSTMKDNIVMDLAKLGKAFLPTAKLILETFSHLTQGSSLFGKAFKLTFGFIIKTMQIVLVAMNAVSTALDWLRKKWADSGVKQLNFFRQIEEENLKNAKTLKERAKILARIADIDKKILNQTNNSVDANNNLDKSVQLLKKSYSQLTGEQEKNTKKQKDNQKKLDKLKSTVGAPSGKKGKKDIGQAQFLAYIGEKNKAELAAEEEKYKNILKTHKLTAEQKVKIDEAYQDRVKAIQKKQSVEAVNNVLNQTGQVASAFGELASIVQMAFNNQMMQIDLTLERRLEAIDIEEQRFLESMGVREETETMKAESELAVLEARLAAQTDVRKKAAAQVAVDEKKKEVQILKAKEDFEKKRDALNEAAEKKKRELIRKTAIVQKAAAIVDTIQNTAVAVMKAYAQTGIFGGPVAAGFIGALGAVKLGLIANQPLPAAANGAFISGSQNGSLLQVAERGRSEAVVPLENAPVMEQVGAAIAKALSDAGGGASVMQNIHIGNDLIYSGIYDATKNREILIDKNGIVTG